jgi:hypothetical protein
MGVTVSLPLFGEPGRELEQGSPLNGRQLRELSATLHERLDKAAATLDTLAAAGWSARVSLFDALLHHPQIATREDAELRLRALGVDPEGLIIIEDVGDIEDDED